MAAGDHASSLLAHLLPSPLSPPFFLSFFITFGGLLGEYRRFSATG